MSNKAVDTSHKTILKTTSIFGSTHLVRIILALISNKFITLFLGPSGLGILSLIKSTAEIIKSFSDFGLNMVAVREISVTANKDKKTRQETLFVLQRIALYTGVLGALICVGMSPFLSIWTFGTTDKFYWFIGLSSYFVITNLVTYKESILQGYRLIKKLVVVNLLGLCFLALISTALYFLLGIKGIVPVLTLSSITKLIILHVYTRSFRICKNSLVYKVLWQKMKPLLALGVLLSINVIFGRICQYLTKLGIKNIDGDALGVGYYEAGMIILISYLGLVFSAMMVDFYPRLTVIKDDDKNLRLFVNNQIETALVLVTPAILLFYVFDEWIIRLLYTKDFLWVLEILKIGLLTILVRAVIWPLGYVLLAKGDKKPYFFSEIFGDLMQLTLTLYLYKNYGLEGIGVAIIISYLFYGVIVGFYISTKYKFNLYGSAKTILISVLLGGTASLLKIYSELPYTDIFGIILFFISLGYSLYLLSKKTKILHKFKKL